MGTRFQPLLLIVAVFAVPAVLGGCGGSSSGGGSSTSTTATTKAQDGTPAVPSASAEPPAGSPEAIPPGVPRRGNGPAKVANKQVIDAWLAALQLGDEKAAARYFAPGALVQNSSPVFIAKTLAQRTQFQRILTCGAKDAGALAAPRDFTVITYKLVERPGGQCGSGTGHLARGAIRVVHGKIAEWYRLPDAPPPVGHKRGPQVKPAPAPPSGATPGGADPGVV